MFDLSPLTLSTVGRLTPHARQCVFWETSPGDDVLDREFVKEAWISRVLLEWGACGLIAEQMNRPIGAAIYAPPRLVPRADYFDAGPVSADAILLTTLDSDQNPGRTTNDPRVRTDDDTKTNREFFSPLDVADSLDQSVRPTMDVRTDLLAGIVADLRGRGVRALETFGRSKAPEAKDDRGCGPGDCLVDTGFLLENGFAIEEDHEHFPRLRLDIETDLLWKADVEKALDQLVSESGIAVQTLGALTKSGVRVSGTPMGEKYRS